MMFAKSFSSKYTGSMYGAGMNVFAVWQYALDMASTGYVELNTRLLGAILGGSEEQVQQALDYLTRPDSNSRSKEEDGRRLVKEGQFQYRIVNWSHYQRIRNEEDKREYNRLRQAEHRAKKKGPGPTLEERNKERDLNDGKIDKDGVPVAA